MSLIQDIRDKYAKISVIAIALALIGFILTDYFSGKNRSRGKDSAYRRGIPVEKGRGKASVES